MSRLQSKGEIVLNLYLRKRFRERFVKIRPDFLKNPKTNRNLEYDFYNERMKLAIEYNGKQHYEYVSRFHKSYEDFSEQVYRDNIKMQISRERDIKLIVIPYYVEQEFQHINRLPYKRFNRIINDIHNEISIIGVKNMSRENIFNMCLFLEKQLSLYGYYYNWYDRLLFKIKNNRYICCKN